MKLEDLQKELKEDLAIDPTKLEYESANNPMMYGKWLNKYSSLKKEILAAENSKKRALKGRLDYYTGRGDEVCMDTYEKSEMKTVLSADEEVLRTETKLQYYNIMLDFCSHAMDVIKSRGFAIKNSIEMRKFEAGV